MISQLFRGDRARRGDSSDGIEGPLANQFGSEGGSAVERFFRRFLPSCQDISNSQAVKLAPAGR